MFSAIQKNNIQLVKSLIKTTDINEKEYGDYGDSPLEFAIYNKNIESKFTQ